MKPLHYSVIFASTLLFLGCQTTPKTKVKPIEKPTPPSSENSQPPSKVIITPYPESNIRQESQPLPLLAVQVPPPPPRVILPEQTAAANNATKTLKDGQGIAAYEKLMQDYLQSLQKNDLSGAENLLIQAQRIAPQSADVYRELARVANIKKQGANAEALARKGLTFAQNNVQRKQLWQQILHSAQLRNNAALIQQAQQNIAKY